MIKKFKVRVPIYGDERAAYVYLPKGYGKTGERFPVLYMFDGHNLFSDKDATFGKSWGLSKYLDKTKTPLIVAAVECNQVGNGRLSEYSPVNFDFRGEKIKGRGKAYMDWFSTEFKSLIDGNFLTLSDRANTFIAGSSMGGLMAIYALANYSKTYIGGAALSPSLWVCGELPKFISNGKFKPDTVLYTDYGSKEFSNHAGQKELFAKATTTFMEKGVNVTSRIVRGGTHSEASWEKQIPIFINVLKGN